MVKPPFLFVGEAMGEDEEHLGSPFVGSSGMELLRMLDIAGIIHFDNTDRHHVSSFYSTRNPSHTNAIWERHSDTIRRTNVFQQHPQQGTIWIFSAEASPPPLEDILHSTAANTYAVNSSPSSIDSAPRSLSLIQILLFVSVILLYGLYRVEQQLPNGEGRLSYLPIVLLITSFCLLIILLLYSTSTVFAPQQ